MILKAVLYSFLFIVGLVLFSIVLWVLGRVVSSSVFWSYFEIKKIFERGNNDGKNS